MGVDQLFGSRRGAEAAIAVVVAHPDDEVIGAGGQLWRWPQAYFVHVTDGSPRDLTDALAAGCGSRQAYAERRRQEHAAMLARIGGDPARTHELGVVDQEASYHLAQITRELRQWLREARPDWVLAQPFEGGHPDHDATAFAVQMAVRWLRKEGDYAPKLVEMTAYHEWEGRMRTGHFLQGTGNEVITFLLSEEEQEQKRELFKCYPSQGKVLQYFPVNRERFRPAPDYDFSRLPRERPLFYERFNWGMNWDCWSQLAREARSELGFGA